MTSTSAIGGTTAAAYGQQMHRKDPMQAVTDLLGGDKKAIFGELRSGKSLDDIAKEKGVSHTDLTAAIAKGLPADESGKAEEIAATKGLPARPAGGRHHHGPPPADGNPSTSSAASGALTGSTTTGQQDRLDRLSSMLGTDAKTLLTQLSAGTTLTSLASAKGVDASKLTSVLQSGDLFDSYA